MEQIRSFVAIELPDDLKLRLGELQAQLKSGGEFRVKWVSPSSVHLTLKFLGDVASNRIELVTEALKEASRGVPPFRLQASGLGVFPSINRVQVAWVGMSGEIDKLTRLQRNVDLSLARLGFTPESRPFAAHLTLARVREQTPQAERRRFGELIASTRFETDEIEIHALSLMRSQLTPSGAIYTRIGLVRLRRA